jgi:hypothetical protein
MKTKRTLAVITAEYNEAAEAAGEKTVKKFKNKATAEKRLTALLEKATTPDEPKTDDDRAAAVQAAADANPATRPPASRAVGGTGPRPLPTYAIDPDRRREPKEGTYRYQIIQMLLIGATMVEIREATGWNERQAREGVRLLHTKCGYGISEDPVSRIITIQG